MQVDVPRAGEKRPNRRVRFWLAMGLGIAALLCLGGVGVAISLYDGATEIKRTAPDAVVDSFLRAYLVNRDDKEVALYTCKSGPDLVAISNLRNELVEREKSFNVKVTVTWSSLAIAESGEAQRSVTTDLIIAGTSNGETQSRHTESWAFSLVEQNGWRVCGANEVG